MKARIRAALIRIASCRQYHTVCMSVFSLMLALASSTSAAHQQKTSVTRILFNSNSGNIEVMHRFFVHDAEHAAGVVFAAKQNLLESAQSRELFSNYVGNRFAIEAVDVDGNVSELRLNYVGEEIDGLYIWVYQEVSDPQSLLALNIISMALRDVWPDQANLVNVEKNGKIQSLTFENADELLTVQF